MTAAEAGVVVALVTLAVLIVLAVIMYLVSRTRDRKFGTHGFVQASRLTCPKCQRPFDYSWVPGAALTAVRLGTRRYMACPLCHRWSLFDIWDAPPPPSPREGTG